MRGVVLGGEFFGDHHDFHAGDLQAFFFEAGEDFADEAALQRIGLEDDEGAFHDDLQEDVIQGQLS